MNREKKLLKNTIIITIGKVCTQLITFFLLPLYTALLTTEEFGIVDLLNTLVSLLLPITTLELEQALFRELIDARNNDTVKRKIISSGTLTVFFQLIVYLCLFLIISPFIKNSYKIFLATNVITYVILSMFQQISRGLGENKKYAIGSFITALFTIVLNIILIVVFRFGATGMLIGTMGGQIIGIFYYLISLKLFGYIVPSSFNKEILSKLLKYSVPLIPNAISWWVFNASDRLIVSTVLGLSQNGILAASLKFSAVYITLYNIFNMSWTESISMAIKDKDIANYFNNMFTIVLKLFIALAVVIISLMPFVYPIMINKNYTMGYNLVPISILASLFHVVVGLISVIYVANKNTKAIANTSIVSAIINIVVHLCLIKFTGLYAAVISSFTAYFIMSIFRIYDINKKYFKIIIDLKLLIYSITIIGISLFAYYLNNMIINGIMAIISIVFAILINKNSMSIILSLIKKRVKKKAEV